MMILNNHSAILPSAQACVFADLENIVGELYIESVTTTCNHTELLCTVYGSGTKKEREKNDISQLYQILRVKNLEKLAKSKQVGS